MKPACETPERASVRFTSVVASAPRLPASRVRTAPTASSGAILGARAAKGPVTRSRSVNAPAALEAVPRKAVVGVGAPW